MTADAPARAGRREWIGLAVIALPCLVYAMDLTVLFLAVPSLTRDLQPSATELLWISDVYGFLVAGCLITMGTLGDRIGRRRLLMVGAVAFGAASVLAAFSTSPEMLIAARALLGIAAATLAPSTLALIFNMFLDPRERGVAIAVWAASFSAGAALGPVMGGALLEVLWWGSVFLLAVPVMALLVAVGPRLLPEFRDPDAGRLDLLSAALSLVAVLGVVYGIKRIAEDGPDWPSAASIAAGAVLGVVFVARQRGLADPLIDLRLFRLPAFSASLAANALAIFLVGGVFFFIAQYLQLVLELSPLEAGLWTVPSAAAFVAGSMVGPAVVRRVRPGHAVAGGLVIAAAGLAMLTQVEGDAGLAVLVAGSVVMSAGLALVVPLATDLIVGSAPPERAGSASGISETGAELGGALGIAVLGSIGAAVYRDRVADAVPAGAPPDAADAARDTLGGAVDAADLLPASVLDTAQTAFADGLRVAALASAAIAVVMAALAAMLLRGPGATEQQLRTVPDLDAS